MGKIMKKLILNIIIGLSVLISFSSFKETPSFRVKRN